MKKRTWLKSMLAISFICTSVVFSAQGEVVKGNPKSKVYHNSTCRYYNAKGSTAEFKTEAEAKKAGYTPCKKCYAEKKSVVKKETPKKK